MDPKFLGLIAHAYPLVEFGVLFRPDKEGQPRYASPAWVESFRHVIRQANIKAAAHLCGMRVNQVLDGDASFLEQLSAWGFRRVQINATAVNGVDTSKLSEQSPTMIAMAQKHSELEFILQKNQETEPLWQGVLDQGGHNSSIPSNITMLVDESKGTGVAASSWPSPPSEYDIGYAGGIGPDNIEKVLKDVIQASMGRPIWIDMESSLRSNKNGKDVFDLDKCMEVINATCQAGIMEHPSYLG